MKEEQLDESAQAIRAFWAIIGALLGLIAGFFLLVWSYKPITGLGERPIWKVSLMDGFLIAAVGSLAIVF